MSRLSDIAARRSARWALVGVVVVFVLARSWLMSRSWCLQDFEAYRRGGWGLLHHRDPYDPANATLAPCGREMPFIYTPFASMVLAPFAMLSTKAATFAIGFINYLLVFGLIQVVAGDLSRDRVGDKVRPAGLLWLAAGAAMMTLASEPIVSTLGLGQINLILMALVVVDLLVLRESRSFGALIGIAVGIKLTPLIFVAYLLVTRRHRATLTAMASALVTVAIGWIVMPRPSVAYFLHGGYDHSLSEASKTANQSINGVVTFAGHDGAATKPVWFAIAGIVFVAGCWAASRIQRRFDEVSGLAVISITGLMISPASWTHHWVWWIVPAAVLVRWAHESSSQLPMLAALGWIVPFFIGQIWFAGYPERPQYDHSFLESVGDRGYVVVGAAFLIGAVIVAMRMRPTATE